MWVKARSREHRRFALIFAVVAVTAGYGCGQVAVNATNAQSTEDSEHFDCPNKPNLDPALTTPILSSGPIVDVAEYHDCQQLVGETSPTDTTSVYLGLFGNFVRFEVDNVFANVPLATTVVLRNPGTSLVAVGERLPGGSPQPTPPDTGQFHQVVTIVAYEAPYDPLRIKLGVNCLYLRAPFGARGWQATMTFNGTNGACPSILPATTSANLEVKSLVPLGGLTANDIPPVTRWDWDRISRQHYIGVRCGQEWCEIGATGFTPSDPIPVPQLPPDIDVGSKRRVYVLKGWYDEQQLAIKENGELKPKGPWAIIVPHPDLTARDSAAYQTEDWVDMAYIYVNADYGALSLIKNVLAAGQSVPANVLRSRMVKTPWYTLAWIGVRNFFERFRPGPAAPIFLPAWTWKGQIVSADGVTHPEFVMKYTDHSDIMSGSTIITMGTTSPSSGGPSLGVTSSKSVFTLIHTARWQWLDTDEDTWVGCLAGCCTKCDPATPGGCL